MDTLSRNYPPEDQRVADADRDHAVSELSEAFQAGRITADEFEQRSGRALSARTGKELTDLFTDPQKTTSLRPAPPPAAWHEPRAPSAPGSPRAHRARRPRRWISVGTCIRTRWTATRTA